MRLIEFKSFLARHTRRLQIVGLFIVFLTFVVKDVVRDQVKNSVDSVNEARMLFILREDIGGLREDIFDLSDQVAESDRAARDQGAPSNSQKDRLDMIFKAISRELKENDSFITEAGELAEKGGYSKFFEQDVKESRSNISDLSKEFDHLMATEQTGEADLQNLIGKANTLYTKLGNIEEVVGVAFAMTYARILESSKKEEQIYKVCTWASWFLYVVGWGLTLTGTLLNIPQLDAAA